LILHQNIWVALLDDRHDRKSSTPNQLTSVAAVLKNGKFN